MTNSQLRAALRAGRRVYGTMIASPSPRWSEAVARIGLDFVFIDTEHIVLDRTQVAWMCQTYRALGIAPIVRIPSPDPYAACMALDGGAAGIIAPYLETTEQVQALRGAVKYRPLKGERLAAALRGEPLEEPLRSYLDNYNRDNLVVINIESVPAMERLEELLAVPEIDVVLIGPHDLSCSLGIPEDYDHPKFEAAVQRIFRAARARGIAAGIHYWKGVERFVKWGADDLNFIIYSSDIQAMREKLTSDIGEIRRQLGDQEKGSVDPINI